jgi:hypothetical protein
MLRDRRIEVKEVYHITSDQQIINKIICFEGQSCSFACQGEWGYYSVEIPKDQYNVNVARTKIISRMNKDFYRWDERE